LSKQKQKLFRWSIQLAIQCKLRNIWVDNDSNICFDAVRSSSSPCNPLYEERCSESVRQITKYATFLQDTTSKIKGLDYQEAIFENLINKINTLNFNIDDLQIELQKAEKDISIEKRAKYFSSSVKEKMATLRETVDTLEDMLPKEYWPIPTYFDMLNT